MIVAFYLSMALHVRMCQKPVIIGVAWLCVACMATCTERWTVFMCCCTNISWLAWCLENAYYVAVAVFNGVFLSSVCTF